AHWPRARGRPPPPVIEAVIFDLDGVLIDSEPMYLEVARRVVAPGVLTDEDYAKFIGTSGFSAWMHETYGIPCSRCGSVTRRFSMIMSSSSPYRGSTAPSS